MIRDRLKSVARKAAIRLLNMEFDTEDRDPAARGNPDASRYDPNKIPPLVDGDGDTPGPNAKEDIGRPWVAAQLIGGVAPVFIDLRPPQECIAGILPGAKVAPAELLKRRLDLLPGKDVRVTLYDQTGELGSTEMAAWLRDQGWIMARRLQGGFAEWIEHDEPVEIPAVAEGGAFKIGDSVRLPDGTQAWIMSVEGKGAAATHWVWTEKLDAAGPFSAADLGA